MNKQMTQDEKTSDSRLVRELAIVIVLKLAFLGALWLAFFQPQDRPAAPPAVAQSLAQGDRHGQ